MKASWSKRELIRKYSKAYQLRNRLHSSSVTCSHETSPVQTPADDLHIGYEVERPAQVQSYRRKPCAGRFATERGMLHIALLSGTIVVNGNPDFTPQQQHSAV